jgi:hypothetical protein
MRSSWLYLAVRSLREGIPLDLRADHAPDAAGDAE